MANQGLAYKINVFQLAFAEYDAVLYFAVWAHDAIGSEIKPSTQVRSRCHKWSISSDNRTPSIQFHAPQRTFVDGTVSMASIIRTQA
nr:hypothetical protein [Pseudomonas californiensis]